MTNDQPVQTPAAPASEEIHLPSSSAVPLAAGIAVTLVVIGMGISLWISALGAVGLVACLHRWIGDSRSEIAELPEAPESD
jgi:hypothetical protein